MTGQSTGLTNNTFHHVAIARHYVSEMINQLCAIAVEAGSQLFLGNGHAHGVSQALTQRACGYFHTGGMFILRVAGSKATPLTEILYIVERQIISGEVQERI